MLSRLSRPICQRTSLLSRMSGGFSCRLKQPIQIYMFKPIRLFSTESPDVKGIDKIKTEEEKAFTPQGAVFSNPDIGSDWIYREEKDTGRKYYVNTKTNEVLYNMTRDSLLAPRWRRAVAASIDLAISVFGGSLISMMAGYELGDMNLGYVVGRIYCMLFFAAKDCVLDHGTRSIGKKLMKLEIVNKGGELSGPYRNFFRNPLELCTAFTNMLGFPLFLANFSLVTVDIATFLIFKKRLFDFALGTRVIPESPDHAMRVKLHHDKWTYKRQSETMEEVNMSGMQQMMEQQRKYDANMTELQKMKEKEKLAAASTSEKK